MTGRKLFTGLIVSALLAMAVGLGKSPGANDCIHENNSNTIADVKPDTPSVFQADLLVFEVVANIDYVMIRLVQPVDTGGVEFTARFAVLEQVPSPGRTPALMNTTYIFDEMAPAMSRVDRPEHPLRC